MSRLERLKKKLKRGTVYRRADLIQLSKSVDRHLAELLEDGTLKKVSQGLYHFPEQSSFGAVPPDEQTLIRGFLKDERFLITSPNAYNSLGVGTTQLYNTKIVYNHKRHGEFKLGNRSFLFQLKHHFPKRITPEFLLVDLVNNIDRLAEDNSAILGKAFSKAQQLNASKLKKAITDYGNTKTKKLLAPALNASTPSYASSLFTST
jgi:hypothetical protein